jgi:hypothetical protein
MLNERDLELALEPGCPHQAARSPLSTSSPAKARTARVDRQPGAQARAPLAPVNTGAPAVVVTPKNERFVPKDKIDENLHSARSFYPLGRVGDLANTITFLRSPDTSGVTGAMWNIDAGIMAGRDGRPGHARAQSFQNTSW